MPVKAKRWLRSGRVEQIRGIAAEQLRIIGYDGGAVDVERVASNLGTQIRYAPYEGDLAGMLIRKSGKSYIAVNSAHHKNRQRFTIAHECGHAILHPHATFVDRSFSILRRDDRSSTAEDISEIEANQFAAELLMPLTYLKRDLLRHDVDLEDDTHVAMLSRKYGVSTQAMNYRIANLFLPRTN